MNQQLLDAARNGNLAFVEQALQNGANLEVTEDLGFSHFTPLLLACFHGHLAVVEYLLLNSHGANLEARTADDGMTPLHWACYWGYLAVVQELVAHGANLEATTQWLDTSSLGLLQGHLAVVQELVARGADLVATDDDGWTPLHGACCRGLLAVVQELVARGADLFIVASDGKTAFDYAIGRGYKQCCGLPPPCLRGESDLRAKAVKQSIPSYNPPHFLRAATHHWTTTGPSTLGATATWKAHGGSVSNSAPIVSSQYILQSGHQWGIATTHCLSIWCPH